MPSARPLATPRALALAATILMPSILSPAPAHAQVEPVDVARVEIGAARIVRGKASSKGFAGALAALRPALEACHRATDDDGAIELRLEVIGPGVVAAAHVNASEGTTSELRRCVRRAFVGRSFGGVGPSPIEVLVPLAFERRTDRDEEPSAKTSACRSSCGGSLDDELRLAIQRRAREAARCFQRGPAPGEPTTLPAGSLPVAIRVATDGSVCGATTSGDGFGRPSLVSCVLESFSASFDTTLDGCVDVRVPLVFQGS
jgi:hypothetical protein